MKKALFKFGFVALLVGLAIFYLPMRSICACESNRAYLEMSMGYFDRPDMTDPQLARAIRTQMDGTNIKKARTEWETAMKNLVIEKVEDFDKPLPPDTHPVNFFSWIKWFGPDGRGPGDCSPRHPWKNGQDVSCKFYQEENLFKKTGWQLDFRITPDGIVRDVKFSSLSSLLGRETLEAIQ